jgi:uncharacterized sulfatase
MVHTPLFASEAFQNTSPRGLFGDVMNEVDWSVGQVINKLETLGIDKNTMVIFSSDNGPWLMMQEHGGSSGLLTDGKGTTWEGGMRVPGIFYMPGTIQPGTITDIGATLDILPTIAAFTDSKVPSDRIMDGYDLSPVLKKKETSPRDHFIYYRKREIYAARKGDYKAHYITETCYQKDNQKKFFDTPLLFNLNHDPSEKYNHANEQPEIIKKLKELVENHKKNVVAIPSEMDKYPEEE